MRGKLIVLEGTDGSGKATQAGLLLKSRAARGISCREIDFPRYGNPFAEPANLYLHGALGGKPGDVNACAASVMFAVDRFASYKEDWGKFYESGGVVVANRYTTSNAVHQASKLPEAEWEGFFRWLFDFECGKLGLPLPDLVVYLDMPTEQAVRLLRSREASTHTKGDIHEVDTGYLALCRKTALRAADCLGWVKIPCVDGAGALRSTEDIHRDIWAVAARILG